MNKREAVREATKRAPEPPAVALDRPVLDLVGIGVTQRTTSQMRGWAAYILKPHGVVEWLTPEKNGEFEDKFRALARARNAFLETFAKPAPRKLNYDR